MKCIKQQFQLYTFFGTTIYPQRESQAKCQTSQILFYIDCNKLIDGTNINTYQTLCFTSLFNIKVKTQFQYLNLSFKKYLRIVN